MSVVAWGQLSKSQDDPEQIEEAIDRIVEEHNDDPDAHLDPGQSLTSHRASEIIDHVARSVVGDKINGIEDSWEALEEGTATAETETTIVDNTKSWATDEWVDHYVISLDLEWWGNARKVLSNNGTTLTVEEMGEVYFPVGAKFIITTLVGSGEWAYEQGSIGAYNGRALYENTTGAYLERTLTFSRLDFYCSTGPSAGIMNIYIGGVLNTQIDLYSETQMYRVNVFTLEYEASDERLVKIEVSGTKNALSTGYGIIFEAFDINGIVAQTSVASSVWGTSINLTTDGSGNKTGYLDFPKDIRPLGLLAFRAYKTAGGPYAQPVVYAYPTGIVYIVQIGQGDPGTEYTVQLWYTVYKVDSFSGI